MVGCGAKPHGKVSEMKIEDVKKVCVAGTGLMGRQIALNCALYGYETYMMSRSQESLNKVETWAN